MFVLEIQSVIVDLLCTCLIKITEYIFTKTDHHLRDCTMFSFFALLVKLSKYCQRCCNIVAEDKSTATSWHDTESKLMLLLLKKLSTEDEIPQMCLPKLINFFLQSLPCSRYLDTCTPIPASYSILASNLVSHFFVTKEEEVPLDEDSVNISQAMVSTERRTPRLCDWVIKCIRPSGTCQGFGGYSYENVSCTRPMIEENKSEQSVDDIDWRRLRNIILVTLKSFAVITRDANHRRTTDSAADDLKREAAQAGETRIPDYLSCVFQFVSGTLSISCLADLYLEQDDSLIEALLCVLDIHSYLNKNR